MDGERCVVDRGHDCGEAGAASVMPIFVPPSVFGEMEAIFNSPVIPDMPENVVGSDVAGIKAGDEIAFVVQYDLAVISDQLTIDPHRNFTIGYRQCFSNVVRVL